ncbi:MAG: FecR domain-containing protein [Alphaproteobacteria bacterium]|uniref:FecR domain-containing protein n=1 Tax=Candidatus Nitrobium versatile TaxID=2884831 RepID=A0A953LZA7_9BACT|nr:FecR domain-containing protein [Candidatus Nitrobium versatile]
MRGMMTKVTVLRVVFCALFLTVAAWSGPVRAEDASVIRASRVDGAVTKNGAPLREGDIVQRDEKIVTGANSAALLSWSNGSMVEIYPDTALMVRGVTYESDRKLEKSLLSLEKGRIFAKAQVPEHLFNHFEVSSGGVVVMTQGAELALKYEEAEKKSTAWSLLGVVIVDMETQKVRIEDGQQAVVRAGAKPENPVAIQEKVKEGLVKTSKRLGGSLLADEEIASPGGPLSVKIGGVKNRRGNAPYTVKFKALVRGGSGKIKSIDWSFGDGESASGKEAKHTFTQGVYVVVLQVEDENGQKSTAQLNISVEENCGC